MDEAAGRAQIVALATSVPTVQVSTEEISLAMGRLRARRPHTPVPAEAGTRYFVEPLTSIMARRSISAQTDAYLEHARILARRVCCEALERSGVDRDTIGLVIGVSCTGFVLPSLDAELIPILGLRPEVARLPITELGCGGGVAGLARAADYLRAYPDRSVLLFSVELPSLTFQPDDRSIDNLVAAMVFGDGAGAAVLRTGQAAGQWIVERSGTMLVPAGAKDLGYELRDGGLRVVLSRRLPAIVEASLGTVVDGFLARSGLTRSGIDIVAAHPGGTRVFQAIEHALGLETDSLAVSRGVFSRYGNASSAGIFFVLAALPRPVRDSRALAIAFGPGLSIELALLRYAV